MDFDQVRAIALSFPNVTEHTTFGSPTFKIGKRFLLSSAKIDPDTLCLKLPDRAEREFLYASNPDVFYGSPHYENFESVLIRMTPADPDEFRGLFEQAWLAYAPKKLVAQYRAEKQNP